MSRDNDRYRRKRNWSGHQKKVWYQTVSFVKTHYALGSLQELCGLFGKTRQAFYEGGWRKEKESMEAALVLMQVALIRRELPKVGTRKLQYLLKDFFTQHQIKVGRDALFSLLIEEGLLVKKRKRKVSTTNSRHRFRKYPNLVRELELVRSEQVWVSDITYIALPKSFCYLSLITVLTKLSM